MILIMSDFDDNSTIYVCQWLLHWNVPFVRIDKEVKFKIERVFLDSEHLDYEIVSDEGIRVKFSDIGAVWYRRGDLNLFVPDVSYISDEMLQGEIQHHLSTENKILETYFYYLMEQKPHLGSFRKRTVNKLVILYEALKAGLEIPGTYIETLRAGIQNQSKSLITKSIFEGFRLDNQFGSYTSYTEKVSIETIQDRFFPSLFQDAIEKEADIRVFYLDGKCFAMAIRSQSASQTTTDFRKYLKGYGNRSFPFELPAQIIEKLQKLMKSIELNTGSIDMIFTRDGRFVFLEVNPVGQFGMTSIPCNYMLEREIALWLTQKDTQYHGNRPKATA
jgi:ATP-GRASP peptide maturase of grasp-with-spasm system